MSVEIFNWYEKQYPSDYRQLIQLKKYTISEMSFLLPRVWPRLDYAQKLLMCAVYNEDVGLARQLLLGTRPGSNLLINPFWACNYVSTWSRRFSSSSSSSSSSSTSSCSRRLSSSSIAPPSPLFDPVFAEAYSSSDEDDEDEDDDEEQPEYFFNQRIDNVFMHSPFYFSVVLKRANMCAFFIEFMKKTMRVERLNHVIKKSGDLTRLVALALSNQSWDIASLILQNVDKPKSVLKFVRMSEYIVQNAAFSLLAMKIGAVEPHTLLVEAARRHAHSTTRLLLEFLETALSSPEAAEFLCSSSSASSTDPAMLIIDLYRLVLSVSIEVGDKTMYAYIYSKLNSFLDANRRPAVANSSSTTVATRSVLSTLTVERIVESMAKIRRTSGATDVKSGKKRRSVEMKELAKAKSFDYDRYEEAVATEQTKSRHDSSSETSYLSRENRTKLMNFIFGEPSTAASANYWAEFESRVRREIESLERFFNRTTTTTPMLGHHASHNNNSIYVHEWSPFYVGEPILVKNLLDSSSSSDSRRSEDASYKLTNTDLILAAQESYSELTIHFLVNHVDCFDQQKSLLEAEEEEGGNFMEHLFVRLCREKQRDSRFALRRIFLDALICRNAKMTCSQPLLDLFLADDQVSQFRLTSTYFPMLFLLSRCFRVFASRADQRRFEQLTAWMHSRIFPAQNDLNTEQIDLVLLEYYSHKTSHFKSNTTAFSFNPSLKELARRQFMTTISSAASRASNNEEVSSFINRVNDSLKLFLFYVLDLSNIFN